MESHYRSVVKALTWRIGGTAVTFGVAWFLTGRLDMAARIGVLDTVIKIGAFYLHERMWNRLALGRTRPPEYQI